MAFTIRGFTQAGNGATATASSLAPAIPAGTIAGDFMLLSIPWSGSTVTLTNPSGWTQLDKTAQTNANLAVFWKSASGSDTAPSLVLSAACCCVASILSVGGWDGNAPVHANVLGGAASTTSTYPAITPNTAADMLIYSTGLRPSSPSLQVTAVAPAGGTGGAVTIQQDICTNVTGNAEEENAIITQLLTAATAIGQQTTTVSQTVSSNIEAVIISPAAVASGIIPQQMRQRVAYQVLGTRPFNTRRASFRG